MVSGNDNWELYFSGERLYGDDFGPAEIAAWHKDEKEGYAELGSKDASQYVYGYHGWNNLHGFRHLDEHRFGNVLGLGSAYGHEFAPIRDRIDRLTIVDPSDAFRQTEVYGIPVTYVKSEVDGALPFDDDCFDLQTCLGVLHHIPNVSYVMQELHRCLKPGGHLVLREPVTSMGDWRHKRAGLTKRERGIPLNIMRRIVDQTGFEVKSRRLCGFPVATLIGKITRDGPFNNPAVVRIDTILSQLMLWNLTYHTTNVWRKFRPTNAYYVLRKN